MSEAYLRSLLGMLDDPDENTAVSVMAELLKHETAILPLLCEMQEADNSLLRKRIQQLESIVTLRRRRKDFLLNLESDEFDLVQGLVDLHMLWFDRDTPELIMDMFRTFMSVAANNELKSIEELGAFMARNGFALPPPEERLEPETYCLGPVLEDRLGSDILLCTLALLAGLDANLKLALVRTAGRFVVINEAGIMISPENNWLPDQESRLQAGDFWQDPRTVLKYASLMLFLYAASSDNFRYVHTIGHALSGREDSGLLDFLPYPYNGMTPESNK